MPVKLHSHQEEAIAKMHNGCILYGDVGTGKTITSLAYYFTKSCGGELNKWNSMKSPKPLYVITTAKVRDGKSFELQAAQMGVHALSEVSTNGVSITVDSWNNLHKYVEVKDAFFIFDEQRVVGYGAWSRAFIKIAKHNEWVLLSATPGDTWLDYIPVFIANGWYKHKTDFIDQHVIWTPRVKYPKVLRYQNTGTLVRRRNQVLVHMPYERHTVRHSHIINCDYDEDAFEKVVKKRWHVYENRPLRDVAELFSVMRKVVNSDSSRLTAVQSLLTKHPKLIVFYNFDYELEMLRSLGSEMTTLTTSSETLSETSRTSSSTSPTGSTSKELCPKSCEGHWTVDRGNGEAFLNCEQWNRISKSTSAKSSYRSASSSETGTDPFTPTTGSDQILSQTRPERDASARDALLESPASSTDFAIAEWNGHKHEDIPATARWLYLVQYRAGAEGWNCIETDAICFYSQTYSYRDWWQAHGRIDRLNTPFTDLHYYYLMSKSVIDRAIRASLRAKKNFNERALKLPEAS